MKKIMLLFILLSLSANAFSSEPRDQKTNRFEKIKRENPNQKYYKMLDKYGKKLDNYIKKAQGAEQILNSGAFVSAMLATKINGKEDVLFLGFTSGHIMKITFDDATWSKVRSSQVLDENISENWAIPITQFAFDTKAEKLYIGYGDRRSVTWEVGIGINDKAKWSQITKWVTVDFDNLYIEHHKTKGGGIRCYDFRPPLGPGWIQRPFEFNADEQGAVLTLRPLMFENGDKYLIAFWGPHRPAQKYTFGVSFIPTGPAVVPVPFLDGGDNPPAYAQKIKLYDIRQSYDSRQKLFYNPTLGLNKPILNPLKQNVAISRITYGNHSYSAIIQSYSDGSIWSYNLAGQGGSGTWYEIGGLGQSSANLLCYNEVDGKEYILAGLCDSKVDLYTYSHDAEKSKGKAFEAHDITARNVHDGGWGSPIGVIQKSADGRHAICGLQNGSVQWFDFKKEGFPFEVCPQPNHGPVTAISIPVKSNDGKYRVFLSWAGGLVRMYDVDTKKGETIGRDIRENSDLIKLDLGPKATIASGQTTTVGREAKQQSINPLVLVDIIGLNTYQEASGELKYYYDSLDYDADAKVLYAYMSNIKGVINKPVDLSTGNFYSKDVTDVRIGMGIDMYDVNESRWYMLSPPKVMFDEAVEDQKQIIKTLGEVKVLYQLTRRKQEGAKAPSKNYIGSKIKVSEVLNGKRPSH